MSLEDRSFEDAFDAFFVKRSGPGLEPISIDVVRAVVRAAVLAEREACALECDKEQLAAKNRRGEDHFCEVSMYDHGLLIGQRQAAAWCAKHIRERPEPK